MSRTTLEVIANSVEEAIVQGIEQFNVSRDQLDVEILDEGSKGFLGIGGRQMRIRLTVKGESETVEKEPEAVKRAPTTAEEDDLIYYSAQSTEDLLNKMNIKAKVDVHISEPDEEGQSTIFIDINGNDLSVLIGRKAETLNALQYIITLILSKKTTKWMQVVVDVEGYRVRRNRQLKQLAHRMAEQAVKTGRKQLLEPMGAAERRIIHLELKDHEAVFTESVGEGSARKVSIVLKK
jgi:spoIIIJ-associated protein